MIVLALAATVTVLAGAKEAEGATLAELRAQAVQRAAARVAPSVVQIESVGGAERVGTVAKGAGPTTGLVIGADGWILSSAFNLAHKPAGVLVRLADGMRHPARVTGVDPVRQLVLLRIEPSNLPVPPTVPVREMRVGQSGIALGRTFETAAPSISVGIVSALSRLGGKAIQTDAKISPRNYGGPLVDLEGRVLGILVPLSPMAQSVSAGVEWYDSGIGFAIPLDGLAPVLDRLKKGDLRRGNLGASFREQEPYGAPPVVAATAAGSAARKGGLEPGDQIVAVDQKAVRHLADFRGAMSVRYAGDTVVLKIQRRGKPLSLRVTLAE